MCASLCARHWNHHDVKEHCHDRLTSPLQSRRPRDNLLGEHREVLPGNCRHRSIARTLAVRTVTGAAGFIQLLTVSHIRCAIEDVVEFALMLRHSQCYRTNGSRQQQHVAHTVHGRTTCSMSCSLRIAPAASCNPSASESMMSGDSRNGRSRLHPAADINHTHDVTPHLPRAPRLCIFCNHVPRLAELVEPIIPMMLDRIGPMPQNASTLRSRLFRLCARKYKR